MKWMKFESSFEKYILKKHVKCKNNKACNSVLLWSWGTLVCIVGARIPNPFENWALRRYVFEWFRFWTFGTIAMNRPFENGT